MNVYTLIACICVLFLKNANSCPSVPDTTPPPTEGTESTAGTTPATTPAGSTTAAETTEAPSDPLAECLGPDVTCGEFKDGSGTRAETGDELECDFDGAPGCDCWANKKPDEDQNEWLECDGEVDPDAVQDCFKTSDVPSGKFVATYVTTKQESGAQAILFSCTVSCAMGGKMTVKQWTKNADLKACAQSRLDALAAPVCQEFSTDGTQTIEILPPGQKYENFDVQLTASDFIGDEGGIAIIDDIKVYLDECVDTTEAPTTPLATTAGPEATTGDTTAGTTAGATEPTADPGNACDVGCGVNTDVECDTTFDFENQEGTALWKVFDGEPAGNFDSGVPVPEDEGKFYGAEVGPGEFASMKTIEYKRLEGKQFRVRHYDALDGAQLKMCLKNETAGSVESCGVRTDVAWSPEDTEWRYTNSDFDQSKLAEDTYLYVICDNRNGENYGACGFTEMDVYDDGSDPSPEDTELQCTP